MKKGRRTAAMEPVASRVLVFDVIRILCVVAIVYAHRRFGLVPDLNAFLYADGFLPLNIYSAGLQGWAVFGLIFVSGAVLQLNYKRVEGMIKYGTFLVRRIIRIYPAFWLSLLFGLVLNIILAPSVGESLLSTNFFAILFEYTGFYVVLGQGQGFINIMGWFIAAIVSLYILFPVLSDIIRKYQLTGLLGIMLVSLATRSFCITYQAHLPEFFWMWFPLCNAFEFCIGIYVVQAGFYPKNRHDYPLVHELADLSFYVFLFHVIIIQAFIGPTGFGLAFSSWLQNIFGQNSSFGYAIWYLSCSATIVLVSYIAMILDRKIQSGIRQNTQIKRFLS